MKFIWNCSSDDKVKIAIITLLLMYMAKQENLFDSDAEYICEYNISVNGSGQ